MRKIQKKSLLSKIKQGFVTGLLALPLACGSSGSVPSVSPPPEPGAPGWIGSHITSLQENENYSSNGAIAVDPEGDSVNYSIVSSPNWLQINSTNGSLSNSRALNDSDVGNQIVTLNASDGTLSTDYAFNIDVKNVSTLSGNIKEMGISDNLNNITVFVGAYYSDTTDSNGDWSIQGVPDGTYGWVMNDLNDPEIYTTHNIGNITINQTQEQEGNLMDLEHKLFRKEHLDVINNVLRKDTGTFKKWKQKPKIYIYDIDKQDNPVDPLEIQKAKNMLFNQVSEFCSPMYTFVDNGVDVEVKNGKYPGLAPKGFIYASWSNGIAGQGSNICHLNGNEITSAEVVFNPPTIKGVYIQEFLEAMIGSGETTNSAYTTYFYDQNTSTTISPLDIMFSEAHFSQWSRPAGNKDDGTPGNHDANP